MDSAQLSFGGVLLLAFCHFLAFVDRSIPSVYAPALKSGFHLTDTELGALQGPAFVLVYAIASLTAGQVLHRIRGGGLLAGCVLLWTAASVAFAFAPDYPALFASRLVLGLGEAAFAPAAMAVLVARAPGGRVSEAVSVFTSGSAMGRSGALLLGGLVLALISSNGFSLAGLEPWRLAALVMALPNLVAAAALLLTRGAPAAPAGPNGVAAALRLVLANPSSLGLHFLAAAGIILMVQADAAWAPSILHRSQGLPPANAAMVAGVAILLGAPAGHLSGGWLLGRRIRAGEGPAMIMAGGAVVAAAAAPLLAFAPSTAWAAFALFVITAGGGAAALAALAGLQPMSPPALRPALTGVYFAFVSVVGVGFGPLLTGMLSDGMTAGPRGLGQALAALMLAAGVVVVATALTGARPWRRIAVAVEAA